MKNVVMCIVFCCVSLITAEAQTVKSVAVYQQEFTGDFSGRRSGLSPEDQQRMQQRMADMPPVIFALSMAGDVSEYRMKVEDGARGPGRFQRASVLYRDMGAGNTVLKTRMNDSVYLVKEPLSELEWELHDETVEIGPLLCYKATAEVAGQGNFFAPGREGPKREKITAWYCPEIDSKHGPGGYWGLPGLILEVETPNMKITCIEIELNPKENEVLEIPTEGQELSGEEYRQKLVNQREARRRRRGGD